MILAPSTSNVQSTGRKTSCVVLEQEACITSTAFRRRATRATRTHTHPHTHTHTHTPHTCTPAHTAHMHLTHTCTHTAHTCTPAHTSHIHLSHTYTHITTYVHTHHTHSHLTHTHNQAFQSFKVSILESKIGIQFGTYATPCPCPKALSHGS